MISAMQRLAVLVFGLAALILNPAFGCGDASFSYGVAELKAALSGTWEATFPGTPATKLTFRLEQDTGTEPQSRAPSLIDEAAACSNRTLVASASACIDMTTMPLKVIALDGSTPSLSRRFAGRFSVYSSDFHQGELALDLAGTSVTAQVKPDGSISQSHGAELVHTR